MRSDQELLADKQGLEGAVDAISKAPERGEGKILVSKAGVLEYLGMAVEMARELERVREAAGTLLDDIEDRIDEESEDE